MHTDAHGLGRQPLSVFIRVHPWFNFSLCEMEVVDADQAVGEFAFTVR